MLLLRDISLEQNFKAVTVVYSHTGSGTSLAHGNLVISYGVLSSL